MQHFNRMMTIRLTILGGGVKKKVTLHDKGGRGDEARSYLRDTRVAGADILKVDFFARSKL